LAPAQAREGPMTVFVYVNTAKQVDSRLIIAASRSPLIAH